MLLHLLLGLQGQGLQGLLHLHLRLRRVLPLLLLRWSHLILCQG